MIFQYISDQIAKLKK
ncbi:hypothetical protein DERP_011829 [Dermatophagoides pteronyssinus]|uniref:Uncharacterized protein n=1 Tax=Dermatophagoides pteronyssinus TaxID=6956 RepID=A0ABQ8JR65_DERPT|nr:hypothetical protein DERP_011829 [Dermatophagoides pteronyssinus]